MVLSCKEAVSCTEDAVQMRRRRRCFYGPESDAEFLRSIADKTPGREDQTNQMRRRQVYLNSYIFVTNNKDEDGARGRGQSSMLWRGRHSHHGSSLKTTTASSSSSGGWWWCAKKKAAGKVLSHLLDHLLACTGKPVSSASASSASHAGAAAAEEAHHRSAA